MNFREFIESDRENRNKEKFMVMMLLENMAFLKMIFMELIKL